MDPLDEELATLADRLAAVADELADLALGRLYRLVQFAKTAGRSASTPDSPVPGTTARRPPSQIFPRTGMLRHAGVAGTMHPPSTPDEPSMYFSLTRAPQATPELPAPARQEPSRTVTVANDRPRAYPPN